MDQLDEARDVALFRSAKYRKRYAGIIVVECGIRTSTSGTWYSASSRATRTATKLSLPWEGLYAVVEVLRPGTYKLKTIDGKVFINAWNIEQLRRFYP